MPMITTKCMFHFHFSSHSVRDGEESFIFACILSYPLLFNKGASTYVMEENILRKYELNLPAVLLLLEKAHLMANFQVSLPIRCYGYLLLFFALFTRSRSRSRLRAGQFVDFGCGIIVANCLCLHLQRNCFVFLYFHL